jgi:hypothetical protein
MTQVWTGQRPKELVPEIKTLQLATPAKNGPGATVKATLNVIDEDNDPLMVKWVLQYDPMIDNVGGDAQAVPPVFPEAIVTGSNKEVTVKMPKYGGAYRLFAFVYDGKGGAAVANLPLFVEGGDAAPLPGSRHAKLPLQLAGENGGEAPFIPSGYMGNYGAISIKESDDQPHSGQACLKVTYSAAGDWGGVVWQSPANDWGNAPGGFDLTGAKKLTFWARGAKGGERVSFGYGIIGKDKKFFDTGKGSLGPITLGADWKEYEFDLSGQDLTRIKSGFYWTLGGQGEPVSFYLDDIQYE